MEGGGSARHRKMMRQIADERDDLKRAAKSQFRGIIEQNVNAGLYSMDYIMDNQLYLPEPPALQKADVREMELLKERKQFRQQTHAEDLPPSPRALPKLGAWAKYGNVTEAQERTMRREQLKADLEDLINCHDDPQSDDEDFLRQVDYAPTAMSRTRDFVNNIHEMIPQYPAPEDAEAEEPMLPKPLPLREQPVPPPSARQVTSIYRRSDYQDKEKDAFNERINNRANEILGWTGGLTRQGGAGANEETRSGAGVSKAAAAEGQRAFAKEMEKLMTRAETLMATDEYEPPKMRSIPPNPVKMDRFDGGSAYGSDYGIRGGGGGGGGDYSTRSFSPEIETLPPRRKVVDEDLDNLFDRTASKIQYKFDPENTKVPKERRALVMSGNTSADMDFTWYKEKPLSKFAEPGEEEGLTPLQRQIRATRMAVDNSMEYYRDKTSTISFADGISCDLEEKSHPEAFGLPAQRAMKAVEEEFKMSSKPRPDPPECASSWRRKRMEGSDAMGAPKEVSSAELMPTPKTEADGFVDEFLDGKLF